MNQVSNIINSYSDYDFDKLKQFLSLICNTINLKIMLIEDYRDDYLEFVGANLSSSYLRSIKLSFNHLIKFFGRKRNLSDLSIKDAENFLIYLRKTAPEGFRVYFRNMKAAFNKAIDWKYLSENPFEKIKLPRKQRTYPSYLSEEELKEILSNTTNDQMKDVFCLAFYTGCRVGEISNLKVSNVNLINNTLTIGDSSFQTKSRRQRKIPITQRVIEILFDRIEKAKKIQSIFIFNKPDGTQLTTGYLSRSLKRALKKTSLDQSLHFHSLRHSFASNLAQRSVPLNTIKELLGHSSISTTEIYSHLNMDTLKEAINLLDKNQRS